MSYILPLLWNEIICILIAARCVYITSFQQKNKNYQISLSLFQLNQIWQMQLINLSFHSDSQLENCSSSKLELLHTNSRVFQPFLYLYIVP